jgi:hypothetical protein
VVGAFIHSDNISGSDFSQSTAAHHSFGIDKQLFISPNKG